MGERSGRYKCSVFQMQSLTEAQGAVKMEIITVAVLLMAVGQSFTKPVPEDDSERRELAEVRITCTKEILLLF